VIQIGAPCRVLRLGLIDYLVAWELQKRLAQEVREKGAEGWLLLLEHPHTYTLGRRGFSGNLLLSERELKKLGASVYQTDRGGDVTYHGPGQLVGYTVFDLRRWGAGVRWYVHTLEAALIDALASLGVGARALAGRPGVWVGRDKIAAIGLHVSKAITTHGFALNVDPDLSYFNHIVPCGLVDAGTTSLRQLVGYPVTRDKAADAVLSALVKHLRLTVVETESETLKVSSRWIRRHRQGDVAYPPG
jgi:lipoyl(octanoyl) transferase